MDASVIRELIELPEVHRRILGAYRGAYSLGVARSPEDEREYVILLRVEDKEPKGIAREVTFNGHVVPVIVRGSFHAPRALGQRQQLRQKRARQRDRRHSDLP